MSESGSRFKASIKSPATRRAESSSLRPAVIAGCYTGAMLTIVMLGALVVANRIPALEPYAFERNAASYALFGILMAVPVFRFITRPARMFISAMIAWLLLTVAYDFAGLYFRNLFSVLHRMPFEILAEGAIGYGILAVAAWVCKMILQARRQSMAPARPTRTVSAHR